MKNMLQKHWFIAAFLLLVIVAGLLRLYQLGHLPKGMTWDEAAIGYNGFAVWTTKRDEWLQLFPISFRSFGDYKAPLAMYVTGFFTTMFGLNTTVLRIPFALAGILFIATIGWLTWLTADLFQIKHKKQLTLFASSLAVFSPWHLHFSRAGFESGLALTLLVLGICLFLTVVNRWQDKKHAIRHVFLSDYAFLFLSAGFLAASLYAYHSAKVVTPLLCATVVFFFRKTVFKNIPKIIFLLSCSILFLLPLGYDSLTAEGATRLSQTSIFNEQTPLPSSLAQFGLNFAQHLDPRFLALGETMSYRHGSGSWGVLLPTTFFLILASFYLLLSPKKDSHKRDRLVSSALMFGFIWIAIALVPGSLGADEVPHSNRTLLALPGFIIVASITAQQLVSKIANSKLNKKLLGSHGEHNSVRDAVIGTFILLHGIFFLSYWSHYVNRFRELSTSAFQEGYLEAMHLAREYQQGSNGKPEVEKIVFSSEYGQPYIYALFSGRISPYAYTGGSLVKYEFKDVNVGDLNRSNTLVVATAEDSDFPQNEATERIFGSDGSVRFHFYYLPPEATSNTDSQPE